jgi:SAM-dependent methyltransferase
VSTTVADYYEGSDRELAQRYVAGVAEIGTRDYCEAVLAHRYALYPEIPRIAAFDRFAGRRVLEIGVGQGADHYMFREAGALLSGIDLTMKHCLMTRQFLAAYSLESDVRRADVRALPFPGGVFDHVYSCGVLMLIDDIEAAVAEIHRVLRPGGTVTVMVYNKASIHYYLKTRLYYGWALGEDRIIGRQAVNDWCTDGPGYLQVVHYTPRDLRRRFARSGFERISTSASCLTPEQVPEVGLPQDSRARAWLEDNFGFFLWLTARKA